VSSMDHLRNKLRVNQQDTQDLPPVQIDAGTTSRTPFRRPAPSFTDELPGTADLDDSIFQEPVSASPPPRQGSGADSRSNADSTSSNETKAKRWPLLEKLQQLEVNRKMLVISLGIAGIATILSMSYLTGIAEPLKGKSKMVRVVTLAKDVPPRTPLSEDMVQIKEVPAAYVPEGATVIEKDKTTVVLGMLTITQLYKGEMLMTGRMSDPNSNTGLATQIPEGHRAITVPTDNAYLMKPGDYVDVIAAISDLNPVRRGKIISIPLLQRAKILAVGNQFSAENNSNTNSGSTPREITVAVPDERVKLMSLLKQSNGKFDVIQRASGDQSIQPEQYTIQEIEDALQGKFESSTSAETPAKEEKTPVKTVTKEKEEDPTEEDISKLIDRSQPAAAPAYTPPRNSYRAPAYTPPRNTYRAPVQRAAPPVRQAAPAPVRQAPRPVRAPVVIQNGVQTQ
jgi:pilus assembly protein CpaB